MNVLVIYHSRTGRTEAIARAIADGVSRCKGATATLASWDEVADDRFAGCDAIIAGSPVYFGTMSAELKGVFDRFLKFRKLTNGKVGAAFATSQHPSGGKETTLLSILQAMLIYGMVITGDPMETGGHFGYACSGAPTEANLEEARLFGAHVAAVATKMRRP